MHLKIPSTPEWLQCKAMGEKRYPEAIYDSFAQVSHKRFDKCDISDDLRAGKSLTMWESQISSSIFEIF